MPLLALMYHRVGKGKHANSLEALTEHFTYLSRYPIVLPSEKLPRASLAICVTFDDATYDFYHYVYPLLKQFKIRAVVGVPVRYILEHTTIDPVERLSVPYTLAMQDGFFDTKAPFCTWQELEEMVKSGYVHVASHSYMHCNLMFPFVDLQKEVVYSKQLLEERLPQIISSFIYPFGKVNTAVHRYVKQYYPYAFRIGSALNFSWDHNPLRRLCADNTSLEQLLSYKNKLLYFLKAGLKSL